MTREQYEKATDILDGIINAERKIKEANLIISNRQEHGVCKQFWDAIADLIWYDKETKESVDWHLFTILTDYKRKMEAEKKKLEKQFEEL